MVTATHGDGLYREGYDWRRYVEGRAVHAGDLIELRIGDQWIAVRYEISQRGEVGAVERLYVGPGQCVFLPADDEGPELRWRRS